MSDRGGALFTTYIIVLLIVTMVPSWLVLLVLPRGRTADRLVRRWARFVIRASGCRVRVSGGDRLRHIDGGAVLVSNHISYIDSVVFMAIVPECRFVAEHGVLTWPLVGTAVRKAGHLTVDRGSRAARAACSAAMIDTLRGGESLLVYPEGRRSRSEGLLPFHLGAFRAAVDAGRPIVPITIRGTDAIVATDRRLVRRGDVAVTIHDPIAPAARDRSEMVRLRDLARERIASV